MSGKSVTLQAGRIITYVLIVLLLVGGVGFVAYFTNGFTDGFKGHDRETVAEIIKLYGGGEE